MISRTLERAPTLEATEFVRFCYHRRRIGWPELYDEMWAVACRGLFRGWTAGDLAEQGIGFGLDDMPALAGLVRRIVAEDAEIRARGPQPIVGVLAADAAAARTPSDSKREPAGVEIVEMVEIVEPAVALVPSGAPV
jgi:hypothetical protein